jgi:hypothetical protein
VRRLGRADREAVLRYGGRADRVEAVLAVVARRDQHEEVVVRVRVRVDREVVRHVALRRRHDDATTRRRDERRETKAREARR